MRWDTIPAPPARRALGEALVTIASRRGWGHAALAEAAEAVLADPAGWRRHFPRGARDAIWYISEVSDASMRASFLDRPAPSIASVIAERLAQNAAMKPFVRRVMHYDIRHPLQAIARMQRTARVMSDCLDESRPRPGAIRLTLLNLCYTTIVFLWLVDRSTGGRGTRAATRRLMGLLKL